MYAASELWSVKHVRYLISIVEQHGYNESSLLHACLFIDGC